MIYIFLSICCSVFVSVLLKLSKRYSINVFQAIVWNYLAAGILAFVFLKPNIGTFHNSSYPIYISLGILLPALFIILAASIRFSGIVRTDIAQRLSLFIPVLASFLIFRESLTALKAAGILTGFAAIIFSIPWYKQKGEKQNQSNKGWIYLLIVFIGLGFIDVLFKQLAQNKAVSFGSSLFLVFTIAFTLSLISLIILVIQKKQNLHWKNFICGLILGIANFGNILFYLKAHQSLANQPSVVFSAMNIGVIILGSIVGILIFKEKLSKLNYIGILLALISVFLITLNNY